MLTYKTDFIFTILVFQGAKVGKKSGIPKLFHRNLICYAAANDFSQYSMLSSHGFDLIRCRNHTASIPSVAVRGRLQMGIGAACCRLWCPLSPLQGTLGRFFARVLLYMLLGWIVVGLYQNVLVFCSCPRWEELLFWKRAPLF